MKFSIKYAVCISCLISLLGCSHEEKLPPPASEEFLTRSVYTFYKSFNEAGPSGVMIDAQIGKRQGHMILTAGHVVRIYKHIFKKSGLAQIGFRKAENINVVRRIDAPYNCLIPFEHPSFPVYDLGVFAIPDISGIENNCGKVCSINIDKPFANGVGFICDESEYAKYSITTGTPVFCFCSDISRTPEFHGHDWNSPTIKLEGKIKDLSAKVPTLSSGVNMNAIVVDFKSVEGNSGGAVFAYGNVNGVKYPFLLGVVSGAISGSSLSAISPIGPMIEEIRKQFKTQHTSTNVINSSNLSDKLPLQVQFPATPKPTHLDCETDVHVACKFTRPNAKEVKLDIDLNGVENNALRLGIGIDENKNKLLELHEMRLQFGWSAGEWVVRDRDFNFSLQEKETKRGNQHLDWVWMFDQNGKVARFRCVANGRLIFNDLCNISEFSKDIDKWDMVRIVRNGVPDPNEIVSVTFK